MIYIFFPFSFFFPELRYSHTMREDNKIAHNLVRYASHITDFVVWINDVPPQVFSIFQTNLADFQ